MHHDQLLRVTTQLLASIDARDLETYRALTAPDLTSFEPEAKGHRIDGLPFHEFFLSRPLRPGSSARSEILNFHARTLGPNSAVACYTRITQKHDGDSGAFRLSHANETRVFTRASESAPWRQSHFHRSEI